MGRDQFMPDLYAILYLQGHLSVAGVRSTLKVIVFFLEVAGVCVGWKKKTLSRNLETPSLQETREVKRGGWGVWMFKSRAVGQVELFGVGGSELGASVSSPTSHS